MKFGQNFKNSKKTYQPNEKSKNNQIVPLKLFLLFEVVQIWRNFLSCFKTRPHLGPDQVPQREERLEEVQQPLRPERQGDVENDDREQLLRHVERASEANSRPTQQISGPFLDHPHDARSSIVSDRHGSKDRRRADDEHRRPQIRRRDLIAREDIIFIAKTPRMKKRKCGDKKKAKNT